MISAVLHSKWHNTPPAPTEPHPYYGITVPISNDINNYMYKYIQRDRFNDIKTKKYNNVFGTWI